MSKPASKADEFVRAGLRLYRCGDVPAAIAEWQAALQLEPNHPEAKMYLSGVDIDGANAADETATRKISLDELRDKLAESWIDSPADDVQVTVDEFEQSTPTAKVIPRLLANPEQGKRSKSGS